MTSAAHGDWLALRTDGGLPELPGYGGFDLALAELDGGRARPLVRDHDSTPEYPRQLAAGGGLVAIALDACGTAVSVDTTTGDLGGARAGGDDAFLIVTRQAE